MNSNLIYHSTVGMSQLDWLKYRESGLGASEVGTVLGLNPYKSSIQLFYEKIGMVPSNQIENMAMFMGKQTEQFIADLWEYWEGDEESVIRNYYAGRKVRTCEIVPAYIRNPKYPWLFVSLDRKITPYRSRGAGVLECKNMSYHAARVWENGIPPMYVFQVHQQIGVTEVDYGELAILQDGRNFHAYEFESSKSIFKTIVEHTRPFWQTVEKGRKIYGKIIHARNTFNARAVEELQAEIDELEPAPDGTEAYRDFMSSKYSDSRAGEMIGTDDMLKAALIHLGIKDKIKKLNKDSQVVENELIKGLSGFEKATFGDKGYVSLKKDVNGKHRFNNAVKKK